MTAWVRCFDIRVQNGQATILSPDPDFVYQDAQTYSGLAKSVAFEKPE